MAGIAVMAPAAFHLSAGRHRARRGRAVSGDYFEVLGVRAAQGRLISPADDHDDRRTGRRHQRPSLAAALRRRLPAHRTTITLDGHEFTVIGVRASSSPASRSARPRDVWVPILGAGANRRERGDALHQRRASWLEMFGRLAPA